MQRIPLRQIQRQHPARMPGIQGAQELPPRRISPAAISVPRKPVAPLKKMISLTCRSPSYPEFPDSCRFACTPNVFYAFELYAIMLVDLQRFVNIYSAAAPTEGGENMPRCEIPKRRICDTYNLSWKYSVSYFGINPILMKNSVEIVCRNCYN